MRSTVYVRLHVSIWSWEHFGIPMKVLFVAALYCLLIRAERVAGTSMLWNLAYSVFIGPALPFFTGYQGNARSAKCSFP